MTLDAHFRNAAKRGICTFTAHFLIILAGISSSLPNYLWYNFFPQANLALDLLRKYTLAPSMSA